MTEDELIQKYFAPLAGPGGFNLEDDAALIYAGANDEVVVSSDMILPGVHFLVEDQPYDIAWKALAVNISDIVAKGANPDSYTVSLAVPQDANAHFVSAFANGLADAQDAFGCMLIGGDTTRLPAEVAGPIVSITAFGKVKAGTWVTRTTAQPGSHLYVTGNIGDAALGLLLCNGKGGDWGLNPNEREHLRVAYHRPRPRADIAFVDLIHDFALAAMDVSDGLVKDAGRMSASAEPFKGRFHIEVAAVPLSPAARKVVDHDPAMLHTILTGGDDYCVLCCVPDVHHEKYELACREIGVPSQPVGHVKEGDEGVTVHAPDGAEMTFEKTGYDHG